MSLDPQRVCQVHIRGAEFGSGYLLTHTLVLTAAHNVESRALPRVRPLDRDWVDAVEVIRGRTADLALVRIPTAGDLAPVRLGRFTADDRVACRAVGFPRSQAVERSRGTEEIVGEVAPLTRRDDRLLTIHVSGSVPLPSGPNRSPWAGYSGAALFCGSVLAGVIRVDPVNYGTDRLLAVPMTALADEPELCEALGGRPALEPVEVALTGLTSEPAIANFLRQYVDGVFGGRGRELARLDEWLDDGPPYFLVTGLPGRGKSALLAEWYRARRTNDPLVYVPISIRYELNRELPVLRAIVTRLAALHGETVAADTVEDLRDALARLVARRPPSGRAALIVDGLDEASGWGVGPSLFPLEHDGGVKVLVSARLAGRRSGTEDWLRALGWDRAVADALTLDALTPEATADVVARAGLAPEIAAKVHDITDGDPLIVGLYVDHLLELPDRRAALAGAEPGLAGFMANWWEDQERQWGAGLADQGDDVRTVWNVLACARGPLDRRDLLELARRHRALTGDELDRTLKTLERLVVFEPPRSYAVSHPRLGTFRAGQLEDDGDLATYTSIFIEWGLERVEALVPVEVPAYVVLHLREHLEAADATPDTLLRLADPGWELAWEAKAGDTTGFVADVERAQASAVAANQAAVAAGRPAPYLDGAVWCGYLLATREHTLSFVGPQFVAALVRHGVWSERRALDHAQRLAPYWRASTVIEVAPHLSAPAVQRALELVAGDEEIDGRAAGTLVQRLAEVGGLETARAEVDRRPPGFGHACAALALLHIVPEDEQPGLLRSVLPDVDDRRYETLELMTSAADRDLASRAFDAPPEQRLAALLRGHVGWWPARHDYDELDPVDQGYALAVIGRWLTPAELERRLTAVLDRLAATRHLNLADAITDLAPLIPAHLLPRAERAVEAGLKRDPVLRAVVRIVLAGSAGPEARERLLAGVDAELPAVIELGRSDRNAALAALVGYGRGVSVLDAVAHAGAQSASEACAAMAPHLDEALARRALPMARNGAHRGHDEGMTAILGRLAAFGPAEAQEALTIAAATRDSALVGAVVTVFAHAGADALDVDALQAIEEPHYRIAAIAGSARLAPATGADLIELVRGSDDALDVFDAVYRSMDSGEYRTLGFAGPLAALMRRPWDGRTDRIVIDAVRRMIREGVGPELVGIAWGSLLDHGSDAAALRALTAFAQEPAEGENRDPMGELAGSIDAPVYAAVARAAALRFLDDAEAEREAAALLDGLNPHDVVRRAAAAALIVEAAPPRLRARAARAVGSDEVLRRQPGVWEYGIGDLARVLELDQVNQLVAAARDVSSSHARGGIIGACAARLVDLGHLDEALKLLEYLDRESLATALGRCFDVAAATDAPRLLDAADRVEMPLWAAQRAALWARAGRCVDELDDPGAVALLDAWLKRRPERDTMLLDLTLFAAPIVLLGGATAAQRLVERLDPGVGRAA